MSRWVGRIALFGGMLSALLLVPVGIIVTVFGFGQVVLNWFEFADSEANRWISDCILGLTFAIDVIPLVLFWLAWSFGSAARAWLGLTMLLLSPIFGWIGFESLVLQGDWGDFLLWAPYLLTGLFMAAVGAQILLRYFYR